MQNLSCWVQQRGMRRPGRPGGAPPSARTCCGVAGLSNLFKTWDIFAFGLGTFSSVNQTREKIFASWTLCHSLVSLLATWYRIGTIPFSTVACLVPPPLLVPTWWESSSMKLSHPISVLLYFFSLFWPSVHLYSHRMHHSALSLSFPGEFFFCFCLSANREDGNPLLINMMRCILTDVSVHLAWQVKLPCRSAATEKLQYLNKEQKWQHLHQKEHVSAGDLEKFFN